MKCDSPVGREMRGCERNIYCSSVVPERGAPTMKIGPSPGLCRRGTDVSACVSMDEFTAEKFRPRFSYQEVAW